MKINVGLTRRIVTMGLSMGTEGHNRLRDEFWKQELVKDHTR